MIGAQGGNPPPWQLQGYNQQANQNGEPPAKKAKGNAVITRYPPPPNYRPPVQPPGPFQQQGWQQPTQPYNYGQQAYPGYPPQGYAQQRSHAQNQWQGYNQQQHFQQPQSYAQNQWQGYGQQQHAGHPSGYYPQQNQGWTAPAAQQPRSWSVAASVSGQELLAPPGHPANWQIAPSADSKPAPLQSKPPADFLRSTKRRNHSEVSVKASGPNAGFVVDGNGDPVPPPSPRPNAGGEPNAGGDSEDEFDRESYFLRRPEDINPDLSIGELVWRPAAATTLALPATYKESQVEIIAPRRAPPLGETSVSEYFYREKREEAFLSVRQLDEWWNIKDDSIFKEFAQNPKTLLPISEMLEKYRDRPDPTWARRSPSAPPVPECESSQNEEDGHAVGGAMDIGGSYAADHGSVSQAVGEEEDILGNLQQALRQNSTSRHGHHSRANSTASVTSNHGTKLKPLMPVRDSAQDDVLKSLGVTGSPKMVYETPGPAFGPPPAQREGSVSQNHSRQSSVVSNSGSARFPPPPPPGQPIEYARRPSYNNNDWQRRYYWNGYNGGSRRGSNVSRQESNGSRRGSSSASRPGSSGSQHTTHGSDFGAVDEDRTPRGPRPKYDHADSRKRGYEDYHNAERDDETTPRQQRYKQPRVDEAYRRRW